MKKKTMKKIMTVQIFLLACALFAGPVSYISPNGVLAGTATTDNGVTTYRDAAGTIIGSSIRNGTQITYRTVNGHTLGTTWQLDANTTYKDAQGRIAGTAIRDGNQITYRDHNSRILGKAMISGNKTTYHNANGQLIGTANFGEINEFTRDAFFHFLYSARKSFSLGFPN